MLIEHRNLILNNFDESIDDLDLETASILEECTKLEKEFDSEYYIESEEKKGDILRKIINTIRNLIKKIHNSIGNFIENKFIEVGTVEVKKTIMEAISNFFDKVKKFLTAPFRFMQKHKKGSTIFLMLTAASFAGLYVKRGKDAKKELSQTKMVPRKEIKNMLEKNKKLLEDANKTCDQFEKITEYTDQYSQIKKGYGGATAKAADEVHRDMITAKKDAEEVKKKYEKEKKTLEKYDANVVKYGLTLLRQIINKLKESFTALSKA